MAVHELTKTQRAVLEFVVAFNHSHGAAPAVRETGRKFGFRRGGGHEAGFGRRVGGHFTWPLGWQFTRRSGSRPARALSLGKKFREKVKNRLT
ncbi:MAG: hypothetical protein FJ386_14695 [Verrucomicrobia bacterium]|nr:hypothetical protein [Verrucomicrobiota bacterium]